MKLTLETIPPTTVEGTPEECCAALKILGLEPMIELPCRRGPKRLYRPNADGDKTVEVV